MTPEGSAGPEPPGRAPQRKSVTMHAPGRIRPSEILKATGVDKTFDRTRALQGATLDLRAGEVHGLLGANGAGKSTLSKVISGHVIPDRG